MIYFDKIRFFISIFILFLLISDVLALFTLKFSDPNIGASYMIYSYSASSIALSEAVSALPDDPQYFIYNPAILGKFKGFSVYYDHVDMFNNSFSENSFFMQSAPYGTGAALISFYASGGVEETDDNFHSTGNTIREFNFLFCGAYGISIPNIKFLSLGFAAKFLRKQSSFSGGTLVSFDTGMLFSIILYKKERLFVSFVMRNLGPPMLLDNAYMWIKPQIRAGISFFPVLKTPFGISISIDYSTDLNWNMYVYGGLQIEILRSFIIKGGYVLFKDMNNISFGLSFRRIVGKKKLLTLQIDSAFLFNLNNELNYSIGAGFRKELK